MNQSEFEICLNLDEEATYITEEIGCSLEQANIFVELEDEYYDSIGLNVYELDATHEEHRSDVVVDDADLIDFICGQIDKISRELCEQMIEAEYKYFARIGLIEET